LDNDSGSFVDRVVDLVDTPEFFETLIKNINKIDNFHYRAKMLMELLSYSTPKIKSQDASSANQGQSILIEFTDAEKPVRPLQDDSGGGGE